MVCSSAVFDIDNGNGFTIIIAILLCRCGFVGIFSIFVTRVVVAKEK